MKSFLLNNNTSKIIQLSGRFDAGEERALKKELDDLSRFDEIVLDLSSVSVLNSGLLNLFKGLMERKSVINGKIKIINVNDMTRKILEANQILTAFEVRNIFPTAW